MLNIKPRLALKLFMMSQMYDVMILWLLKAVFHWAHRTFTLWAVNVKTAVKQQTLHIHYSTKWSSNMQQEEQEDRQCFDRRGTLRIYWAYCHEIQQAHSWPCIGARGTINTVIQYSNWGLQSDRWSYQCLKSFHCHCSKGITLLSCEQTHLCMLTVPIVPRRNRWACRYAVERQDSDLSIRQMSLTNLIQAPQ